MKVPCELIIWQILPTIRREFARTLVEEFNLNQRETAKKLGLTESAVSQYIRSKRGKGTKFNKKINIEIKKAMRESSNSKKDTLMIEKTCKICALIRNFGFVCKLHRIDNLELAGCRACLPDTNKKG